MIDVRRVCTKVILTCYRVKLILKDLVFDLRENRRLRFFQPSRLLPLDTLLIDIRRVCTKSNLVSRLIQTVLGGWIFMLRATCCFVRFYHASEVGENTKHNGELSWNLIIGNNSNPESHSIFLSFVNHYIDNKKPQLIQNFIILSRNCLRGESSFGVE